MKKIRIKDSFGKSYYCNVADSHRDYYDCKCVMSGYTYGDHIHHHFFKALYGQEIDNVYFNMQYKCNGECNTTDGIRYDVHSLHVSSRFTPVLRNEPIIERQIIIKNPL